jgi:hypothetical protein
MIHEGFLDDHRLIECRNHSNATPDVPTSDAQICYDNIPHNILKLLVQTMVTAHGVRKNFAPPNEPPTTN